MSYDPNKFEKLAALEELAKRARHAIDQVGTDATNAIKSATYSGNTLNLFRTADGSGTAAFSFDLPEEMFLDQAHTSFVHNFEWSAATYPGSTNPSLDGKPVMVLAVKGDATNPVYSFLDMQQLVDTYSAADASVVINGYTIGVKIDNTAGNAITLVPSKGLRVDISGKADKVANATSGNFAALDANGNLTDSGKAPSDFVLAETDKRLMTNAEGTKLEGIAANATKVEESATNGNIKINGVEKTVAAAATDAEVNEMLSKYFAAVTP